jgi:DNA repair exonuclease SbcCD ATPase subunit
MSEEVTMNCSIKKTLLAMALGTLTLNPLYAKTDAQNSYNKEIRNEVGIMLNILQASLKQKGSDKKMRFKAESVYYLADQGVVFGIDSRSNWSSGNFFGIDFEELLSNIPGSVANAQRANGSRFEIDINEDEIEKMVESFMRQGNAHDGHNEARDNMRELSEQQRELAWEKREYERNTRDLEFERRNADGDRRKEIENKLAKLKNEVKNLESKSNELENYKSEIEAEHNKQMATRDAARKKLYRQALSAFEDTIGDMLCRYGAGLRSLPEDQNISFILTDFVDAEDDSVIGTHDKVYVFKHKDVKACVTGKSNKNKLLSSVNTYLF